MSTSTNANPSICTSEKRLSQWEELMRKFSRAHKEECKSTSLTIPRLYRSTKYFPTGSQYKGTWDVLGISGYGTYTFPNGVVYMGDFEDGVFHGKGQILYKDKNVLQGKFENGEMVERQLYFSDGLKYEEHDWKYCKAPDRRYAAEYQKGLMPAGESYITAEKPPRKIPPGFYDTGDGFYNPVTKAVYKSDDLSAILRSPGYVEQKWIIKNCRVAPEPNMGPSMHLYQKWSVPETKLPVPPKPASAARECVHTKTESFYKPSDLCKEAKVFYDPGKWPFATETKRWIYNEFISPIESLLYASDDLYEYLAIFRTYYGVNKITNTNKQKQALVEDTFKVHRALGPDDDTEHVALNVDSPSASRPLKTTFPEPSIKFKKVHYQLTQLFKEKLNASNMSR